MISKSYSVLAIGTALSLIASAVLGQEAERDAVQLQEIVVDVGAGADMTAGADVIEISEEEIDRKKPTDLREIFTGEPQIQVGGAIPMSQKIYVNGVEETNLAITVDGSRQNNKVFHHSGNILIDPALLKAATVSAGVAPADAGPGALGGSLGFETKDAADLLEDGRNFGGFITGSWDSNSNTFSTGLSAFGRADGFEYLGYINYANGDNFTAGNGEEMLGTGTNLLSGLAKLAYESIDGDRFELSHERVRDDDPRPARANFYVLGGDGSIDIVPYALERQNTVFTYTDASPEGLWDPKVVIAYSATDLELPYSMDAGSSLSLGKTASFNGKAENRFAIDLGTITAGFDFYSDKANYEYVDPAYGYTTREKAANVGAYVQARLTPFERMRLAFGGRADNQWFTGTDGSDWTNAGVSGNISGEYDIFPEFLTAKAGASHVWGGVPLAENYIQNPDWVYDEDPVPVTSNNVTAGLKARFDRVTLEANVFRTSIHDARLPSYRDVTVTRDLETRGWEIGGRYDWENGFLSVKYADVTARVDGAYPDSYYGIYLTTPLGKAVSIGGGYTFVDYGVKVGGDVEISFDNDDTIAARPEEPGEPKKALSGYEVVNAYVEWTPPSRPNFTLRADARNIFDETYSSRASYGGDYDYPDLMPAFEPGRSFRLSATMRF